MGGKAGRARWSDEGGAGSEPVRFGVCSQDRGGAERGRAPKNVVLCQSVQFFPPPPTPSLFSLRTRICRQGCLAAASDTATLASSSNALLTLILTGG